MLGAGDGTEGGGRRGRFGLGGPYVLSDEVHVTLGGGNGLGGITGDDGTCQATHAGKPSLPCCLEESGEGKASKGKVGGGCEDGIFNVADIGQERGGKGGGSIVLERRGKV
jgi:hypothetical protein